MRTMLISLKTPIFLPICTGSSTSRSTGGGAGSGTGGSTAFYKQNKPDKKRQKETTNPFLKMLSDEEEM